MSMSAGMWVIGAAMMGVMLLMMVGMGWGAVRRRLRRAESDDRSGPEQ